MPNLSNDHMLALAAALLVGFILGRKPQSSTAAGAQQAPVDNWWPNASSWG